METKCYKCNFEYPGYLAVCPSCDHMNKDVKKCRKCYYENEVGSKNCGQCGEEKWEFNGGIGEYWGFFVNSSKKERSGNSTRDATRKEFALNILRGVGVMFCLCLTPVARFFAAIMMSALGLAESFLQKILKIFLGLMLLIFLVSFFSGERGDDEGRVLYNLTENGKIKVCKFAITAMFSPKNNVVSQGSFVGYEKG